MFGAAERGMSEERLHRLAAHLGRLVASPWLFDTTDRLDCALPQARLTALMQAADVALTGERIARLPAFVCTVDAASNAAYVDRAFEVSVGLAASQLGQCLWTSSQVVCQ